MQQERTAGPHHCLVLVSGLCFGNVAAAMDFQCVTAYGAVQCSPAMDRAVEEMSCAAGVGRLSRPTLFRVSQYSVPLKTRAACSGRVPGLFLLSPFPSEARVGRNIMLVCSFCFFI